MSKSKFVYVSYIRTTPEKLWQALTEPEFTRQYWFDAHHETTWQAGAPWALVFSDGRKPDTGSVLEIDPPRRLVLSWRHQLYASMIEDGHTRCTFTIEPANDGVKLTVLHESDIADSKLIGGVSNGWPSILSSLKTLLETGQPLPGTSRSPA